MLNIDIIDSKKQILGGIPHSYIPIAVTSIAKENNYSKNVIHICRDAEEMEIALCMIKIFDPQVEVLTFPGWDCMPYDRVSPKTTIMCQRLSVLNNILTSNKKHNSILLTTINAIIQRIPPRDILSSERLIISANETVFTSDLSSHLIRIGYLKAGTVREPGEFAIRGGIIDIFTPNSSSPCRLDLVGERVDKIKEFDPLTQRTGGEISQVVLSPVTEIVLDEKSIAKFKSNYTSYFGALSAEDELYSLVSSGAKTPGIEHYLPFFYSKLDNLFTLLPDALITLSHGVDLLRKERLSTIKDNYLARKEEIKHNQNQAYKPLPIEYLTIDENNWNQLTELRTIIEFSPYSNEPTNHNIKEGRSFVSERINASPSSEGRFVFDLVGQHIQNLISEGKRILITAVTEGSKDRLVKILRDYGINNLKQIKSYTDIVHEAINTIGILVADIGKGFESNDLSIISEEDILGEKIKRKSRRKTDADELIRELSSLSIEDLVVHADHGIGRFIGLETLDVQFRPHDCLVIKYHGGDRMYLPVENIEMLSRYGRDENEINLDRLGGSAWQARMSKTKSKIKEIANELINVAARRDTIDAPKLSISNHIFSEFCSGFPFTETEDQDKAISDVLNDLQSGKPMDRLICGDVGFGKTEIALRSAFIAAMSGKQVALVVPTTLLVRQHINTFKNRFKKWPIKIATLTRATTAIDMTKTKDGLANGSIDIVVGTHSILGKNIQFANLGLLIVDEEQRFGVSQKESIKDIYNNIHVLSMTATPIPRTLQMSLAGVRELSLIATPPVDRLSIRTFILPFDGIVIREAIQREFMRGGQVFYVCPRIKDLEEVSSYVKSNIKGAKVNIAHGQLPDKKLEQVMTEFYEGKCNVLVSSNIIESGLDIPSANTLIIHRSDMFGLSELYQLRGRVGRSKVRAYAYLTIPTSRELTPRAEKRLNVMQSLDGLGAGFSLASHDMDIRGAGNLLGSEQSGHIKEVGFELYQTLLKEAVGSIRASENNNNSIYQEIWSPQINLNTAVLIPKTYIEDLDLRLAMYKRISHLKDKVEIENFATELIDRFGSLPNEVEHLLEIVDIKQLLYVAGVSKFDAGQKGVTFSFRNNNFANINGLVDFIKNYPGTAKLRPDHTVVIFGDWAKLETRIKNVRFIANKLVEISTVDNKKDTVN